MVARGVIGHSSVMRDLLFSQRVTRDVPLRFPSWLISFQTTSRDIKNTIFSRSSTSDFIRSNDNRIPLNVVNILFHFSVICDRFSPPLSPPPPTLWHPVTPPIQSSAVIGFERNFDTFSGEESLPPLQPPSDTKRPGLRRRQSSI